MDNNENLNKLAYEVLKNYSVTTEEISVIQSGTIKTVWKIKGKEGMLCLKRLKQTYDKALFSVNAQKYIKETGGNVPKIIKAKNENLIVQYNDQLFVLYEWLHGKDLNFSNNSDLQAAIKGLAKFHAASKGYNAPAEARISSKLGRWVEQYNSMKTRLLDWKELSKSIQLPYHTAYLKQIDPILEISDIALNLLSKSSYKTLASPGSESAVLCHQDFGRGNAISTEKGVFVIDLDGVTFDVQARDLRKIICKQAETKGRWSIEDINSIIKFYEEISPLKPEEKELIYIDLFFPHLFFGLIKNLFQNNKPLKPSEIERMAKLEQSKIQVLKALLKKYEKLITTNKSDSKGIAVKEEPK